MCVQAASKDGANSQLFEESTDWEGDFEIGYRANGLPVTVTFPKDRDGVARICVVEATLASREQQAGMVAALNENLKGKPIEQSDSMIWMFGKPQNIKGLQFYTDNKSDQPKVRLIGAAF